MNDNATLGGPEIFLILFMLFLLVFSVIGVVAVTSRISSEIECEKKHNVYDCVKVEYWTPAPVKE